MCSLAKVTRVWLSRVSSMWPGQTARKPTWPSRRHGPYQALQYSVRPRWEHSGGRLSARGRLPDGHGMILIARRVDIEDTTYRVIYAGVIYVGLGP
jgi:hypothetical protein